VNHGETLKLLAKSISQIAARLPRFKLMSKLYPDAQMRLAIETLYSCLLEFLIRAHGWCNESKISHFYHNYTRPHELRYKDLLERVTACSNDIIELAAIGSQAELRLMHKTQDRKLDVIISLLEASGLTINDLVEQTVGSIPKNPGPDEMLKQRSIPGSPDERPARHEPAAIRPPTVSGLVLLFAFFRRSGQLLQTPSLFSQSKGFGYGLQHFDQSVLAVFEARKVVLVSRVCFDDCQGCFYVTFGHAGFPC
jgi:hypothetical protein